MISGNVLLFRDIKVSLGLLTILHGKCTLYFGKIATSRCQQLQIIQLVGDGQNTYPQSMDYPNGLPLKILFQMNTTLRSCNFKLTLIEPAYFCSAWPSAAILNNYTEITTAGHKKRRFKPHEVNSCFPIASFSSDLH